MNHASGDEAVGTVFTDGGAKGKAKWEDQGEAPPQGKMTDVASTYQRKG
jgi:hypothetical protein